MLDNTVYLNAGADASTRTPGDHSYNSAFTEMELAWLKADLATVKDKNAPLVIGTHCQVFYYNSSLDITRRWPTDTRRCSISCSPTSRTCTSSRDTPTTTRR